MDDKFSTTSQIELTRRSLLGYVGAAAGAAALAGVMPKAASAATPAVKAYGVPTSALKDWTPMEKSIGITCELSGANNDVGVFMRDIMASDIGKEMDIFTFESGTQNILGPKGFYARLDEKHPELTLWQRTSDDWKRSPLAVDPDGNQWGVPMIGNADSFGYFPAAVGVPAGSTEELSWSLVFDDEKTHGRVAYGKVYAYSMGTAALYLQSKGATFGNLADLTPAEAKTVADFLIERKKAGQFRTLYDAFEEQIQLLTNKEVDVINCWEPAVREANNTLGPNTVFYAYTKEGYNKWGIAAYISAQAIARGNGDNIYKVLNYFLGGEYHALQARDRGYGGPNLDLAVEYAEKSGWSADEVAALKATEEKVRKKFTKPYVSFTTPKNASAMEEEWQRFLNA
ncbi:Tat (twin-arginine translocation) pathway signal sequence [Arboricoccus pini]|uniref:Tat (Twin-arginine translocation) pathway signal sequence n=1 Tax=Arboricoccus pini TaxID=1963835 RepID=A0A212Q039_9PROT|nr:PotD/PotF family extracellular solute-binding protein [Arboricoccus pini]SNB52711.1 Tat (twin-arginine translocation) pathway signal sequence [Arboricoccus pini]